MRGLPLALLLSVALWSAIIATVDVALGLRLIDTMVALAAVR
jgi:hypothetical protein